MILTAVAAIAAVATPFAGAPSPTFIADDYDLTVNNAKTGKRIVHHVVLGPERFLTNPTDAAVPDVVARDGQYLVGATKTTKGRKVVNRYQSEPDGIIGPDDLGLKLARFAVTEARAGKLTLTPDVMGGRAVFRVDIDLPANTCRKLAEGTATLWMTRTTLLPRRLEVERDGKTTTWSYRFGAFNQGFQIGILDPPALGSKPALASNGFRRRTPAVAGGPLPFVPQLPQMLPSGFKLVSSGWAPRGSRTGAGAVNKRDQFLFSAVYAKGWERIEVTQRVATNGTWKKDPFSRTCLAMAPGRTTVGTRPAHYAIGTEITSHLWWREGGILHTVSGPYGKQDLQAIALSLKKIA